MKLSARTGWIRSCSAMAAGSSVPSLPHCWRSAAIFTGRTARMSRRGENAESLLAAFEKAGTNQPRAATSELAEARSVGRARLSCRRAGPAGEYEGPDRRPERCRRLDGQGCRRRKAGPGPAQHGADPSDRGRVRHAEARSSDRADEAAGDARESWFELVRRRADVAIAHYQLGQYDQAGALYGRIAKLPGLAKSLQSRSVQMAGMLGVDPPIGRQKASPPAKQTAATPSVAGDQKGNAAPKTGCRKS